MFQKVGDIGNNNGLPDDKYEKYFWIEEMTDE